MPRLCCLGFGSFDKDSHMKDYRSKGRLGACLEIKNNNYGSMLQSFATQFMLREYGFSYDLLAYKKKYSPLFILKSLPRFLNRVMWMEKRNELQKKRFIKAHPQVKESVSLRANAFRRFREQHFQAPVVTFYGYDALCRGSRNYAAFLTGSDQLWSPSGLPTNFYNLMFTYPEAVRISYASSFGVKDVPWYQKRRTKAFLERIPFVSCREKSGAEIVRRLTGRDVPVVADPTLLFSGEWWAEQLPCPRTQEGEYIFCYFLGGDPAPREAAIQLSRAMGLPIVSIHQFVEADNGFGDVEVRDADPAKFAELIRNAACICTDSFHGSVFSILFHRPFVVFNRYSDSSRASKNTRIENLCAMLGLTARRFSGSIVEDMTAEIDYAAVDARLEAMRHASRAYLENAFDFIPNSEAERS